VVVSEREAEVENLIWGAPSSLLVRSLRSLLVRSFVAVGALLRRCWCAPASLLVFGATAATCPNDIDGLWCAPASLLVFGATAATYICDVYA